MQSLSHSLSNLQSCQAQAFLCVEQDCLHTGLIGGGDLLKDLLQLVSGLTGTPAQTATWSQNAQKEFQGEHWNLHVPQSM